MILKNLSINNVINKYLIILSSTSSLFLIAYGVYYLKEFLKSISKKSTNNDDDYYSSFHKFKTLSNINLDKRSALNYNKSVLLKKEKKFVNKPILLKHERQQKMNEFYDFLKEKLSNYPDILYRKFNINNDSFYHIDIKKQFRVMQWNGLAKKLSTQLKKSKCLDESIDWYNFRQWRLLEELVRYDSDIICLQEADFYDDIKSYLHYLGYTSIFCPKYSPSRVYNSEDPDGCAIFYHTTSFQITQLRCQNININGLNDSQVFIIMQLRHKQTNKRVNIICSHLKAFDEYSQKRYEQIEFILKILKETIDLDSDQLDQQAFIFCGDLNGERREDFYKLIINDDMIKFSDCYFNYINNSNISRMIKNVDYIFYTKTSLKLVNYLDIYNETILNNKKFFDQLPSLIYPSDHLSLVCDFQFC